MCNVMQLFNFGKLLLNLKRKQLETETRDIPSLDYAFHAFQFQILFME